MTTTAASTAPVTAATKKLSERWDLVVAARVAAQLKVNSYSSQVSFRNFCLIVEVTACQKPVQG